MEGGDRFSGDEGRAAVISLFSVFQEVSPFPVSLRRIHPIVEHEELAFGKGMQEFAIASVGLGDRKVLVCPDGTRTQNVAALAAGLRVQETCEKSEQRLGRLPRGAYGSALRNHGSSCLQACVDAKLSSLTSLFS